MAICAHIRQNARRTKIVATLGPATESYASLENLVRAGVDVVRMNFSHGSAEDHKKRADVIREVSKKLGCDVAILGDLQGPKIRIEKFRNGSIELSEGDHFILDASLASDAGDQQRVGVTYKVLIEDVKTGDVLVLDDGRIVVEVNEITGGEIHTTVINGGTLSNNKGINRRGGGLSADALTDKDRKDIQLAAEIGVDYLAVSFPRSADDMHLARQLLNEAGGDAGLVAKIERAEALECIDSIMEASDVIMIARGDLGVEIGDAELPAAQKSLIKTARKYDKIVITATQMMETMIVNPVPTRAEVFDVANAVLDGTDAVMLSGETAVGRNPEKVVTVMGNVCHEAEKAAEVRRPDRRQEADFRFVDEAIAKGTMYTANHLGVSAIAALTESGNTTRWMSRISSDIPIFAMTQHERTRRRVKLYRGVYPVDFPTGTTSHPEANIVAVEVLERHDAVKDGDLVIITKGDLMGNGGGTNAMKIVEVGKLLKPIA